MFAATRFSQWKLIAETAAPSANPMAQLQPCQINSPMAPAAPSAKVTFQIRETAPARCCSSSILGVAHDLANHLGEPGGNTDQKPQYVEPVRIELTVQQITERIPQQ